jgi:hypothetical protein
VIEALSVDYRNRDTFSAIAAKTKALKKNLNCLVRVNLLHVHEIKYLSLIRVRVDVKSVDQVLR